MATGQETKQQIYDLAGECEGLFGDLLSVLSRTSEKDCRIVQEHQQRFERWSGYLGVFAAPQASLDSRLKSTPDIRDLVVQLLEVLKRNIRNSLKFESARAAPRLEDDGSISKTRVSEQFGTARSPISPATQAALDGIRGVIDRLHRLGTAIRKAPTSNLVFRVKKFARKDSEDHTFFEHIALLIVKGLYPNIRDSLARQLARSISFRRQRLLYQRQHQKNLTDRRQPRSEPKFELPIEPARHDETPRPEPEVVHEKHQTQNTIGASTVTYPSAIDIVNFRPNIVEMVKPVEVASAPPTVTSIAHNNPYPPPPKIQDGEEHCQCNWCFREIEVPYEKGQWRHVWRSHFKEDLEPYVCISEQCGEQPVYFAYQRNWRKHMDEFHTIEWIQEIHKHTVWYCDLNQHEYQEFSSSREFHEHLMESHSDLTPKQLDMMERRNVLSIPRGPNICPLCSQDISILDTEPNQVQPSSHHNSLTSIHPNKPKRKPIFHVPEGLIDSDEEQHPDRANTDPSSSEKTSLGIVERPQARVNHIKLATHVAGHLKSLAFTSLRYFGDESTSAESQEAALGVEAEELSSQGQHSDHYFDLDSSLSFEDVALDQRIPAGEEAGTGAGSEQNLSDTLQISPTKQQVEEVSLDMARVTQVLQMLDRSSKRNRKDIYPDRCPGTCEWFTSHLLFQYWIKGGPPLLWLSANPGCGKSVLAKYLVDSGLEPAKSRTICSFFFNDNLEDQRSFTTALCCILSQLFRTEPTLLSRTIVEQLEIIGRGYRFGGSFDRLWDVLLTAAEDKDGGEIICVLDAIDECKSDERARFIRKLHELYSTETKSNLKFFFTSRPSLEIESGLLSPMMYGRPLIHIRGEDDDELKKISREVNIFTNAGVGYIGQKLELTKIEQTLLSKRLKEIPNSTFLWVRIVQDFIEKDIGSGISTTMATLDLPKTLYEAYERILSTSQGHDFWKVKLKSLLHIIIAAEQPLTLRQTMLALTFKHDRQPHDHPMASQSEDDFRNRIRYLCGLVTVIDSRVYLLHNTIKEFLIQDVYIDSQGSPGHSGRNATWQGSIRLEESHKVLANICIRYLLSPKPDSLTEDLLMDEDINHDEFLDYSAQHWIIHLKRSRPLHPEFGNKSTLKILKLCDTTSKHCLSWLKIYWASTGTDFPERITTLMVASYFGFTSAVKFLVQAAPRFSFGADDRSIDRELNATDDRYQRSALSWAAENGHDGVVKELLEPRTLHEDIFSFGRIGRTGLDSRDIYLRTPLTYAVRNEHMSVVSQLLGAGARIDLEDHDGETPLSYAISSGNENIVKKLLKHSSRIINTELLFSAVKRGQEKIVKVLLETAGVSPNIKDSGGWTPLQWATKNGNETIIQLLVERDANVEVQSINDDRPYTDAGSGVDIT
ncbi:hypothetical protein TWF718_006232 [Orbilia javanica]|uniref:Nephrocystin 3-like N-terminal domain-containing protein n=1 Tax=Orbilia javanica TaxID=47235 RepID=A0AAN8MQX8_9PEZI